MDIEDLEPPELYCGRCIGGPLNGQTLAWEKPYYRAAVWPEFEPPLSIGDVMFWSVQTIEYRHEERATSNGRRWGRWKLALRSSMDG